MRLNLKRGLCRNRQRLVAFQRRHGGFLAIVSSMSHSRLTAGVQSLLTRFSICTLFDRRTTFHETFDDTQSLITGFARGLRAEARLRQNPGDNEEERLILLRSWALPYLLRRLELLQPVSREDGISLAQLAIAYENKGLVPR